MVGDEGGAHGKRIADLQLYQPGAKDHCHGQDEIDPRYNGGDGEGRKAKDREEQEELNVTEERQDDRVGEDGLPGLSVEHDTLVGNCPHILLPPGVGAAQNRLIDVRGGGNGYPFTHLTEALQAGDGQDAGDPGKGTHDRLHRTVDQHIHRDHDADVLEPVGDSLAAVLDLGALRRTAVDDYLGHDRGVEIGRAHA